MYCPKCGAHNEDVALLCQSCGQPIKKGKELAGFWRRYGAFALDYVILYAVTIIMMVMFALVGAIISAALYGNTSYNGSNPVAGLCICGGFILDILIAVAYYAWFESSKFQATPGKMAVGMIVVDLQGKRIPFGKALIRTLAKVVSALILGIGFFIIGFTEKRQGLHDMAAGTTVVMKNTAYMDLPAETDVISLNK